MSLLFNMLPRFVIAFLPRSKHLLIWWLQSPSAVILEPKKLVSHCFHFSPSICHEVMRTDAMLLVFWMLSFKPAFSLSSFTFIKRLFSSSSLSAIRVVTSAYLSLLIFLPAILIPACASSSLVFCMIYSAYKLNTEIYWNHNILPEPSALTGSNQGCCFYPATFQIKMLDLKYYSWNSDCPIALILRTGVAQLPPVRSSPFNHEVSNGGAPVSIHWRLNPVSIPVHWKWQ